MFKLKKILNKHNNAPELEKLRISYDSVGSKECIYYLSEGALTYSPYGVSDGYTYYIIYNNVDEISEEREVLCARVTPDMIFEVNATSPFKVGDKFLLQKSNERAGYDSIGFLGESTRSDGYVVDVSNRSNGTVLVRFHCAQ